jgi:hypothetical protein
LENDNTVRLLDILLIGPVNILFSLTVLHEKWLFYLVFLTGVLTIFYNYINFNRFYKKRNPRVLVKDSGTRRRPSSSERVLQILPPWIQNLFWDPVNGKTQLLRVVNLLVMYPLLTYALLICDPQSEPFVWIVWLMGAFVVTGFFYNLYYYFYLLRIDKK